MRPGHGSSDEGAVAVTTAIVLTILLALMAFVVDLGFVRADVRKSQTAAGSASQAGVHALSEGGTYQEACQASVDFLESNLGITLPGGFCDPFAPATFEQGSITCETRAAATTDADGDGFPDTTQDPTVDQPLYVETTVDDHTIRIQMPVRDTDEQMAGQTIESAHDGSQPCQRVAVSVRRHRDLIFGSLMGATGQLSGPADAVSRYSIDQGDEIVPSLVVLDPSGCVTINARSAQSMILVGEDHAGEPGAITVDSDGTGCDPTGTTPNDYTMRVGGNGARICAGLSNMADLLANTTDTCMSAPETLFATAEAIGKAVRPADDDKISPDVLAGEPVTRRPIDHRYNCLASYPSYTTSMGATGVWGIHYGTIEGCDDVFGGTSRPIGERNHVQQLAEEFAVGSDPTSWEGTWDTKSGGDCNIGNNIVTWDVQTAGDHLYLDCSVSIQNNGRLTIETEGFIVISGGWDVKGELIINPDRDRDVAIVVNGTGTTLDASSGSELFLDRSFVYMNQGTLDIRSDVFEWDAPVDRAYVDDPSDPNYREPDNCDVTDTDGDGDLRPSPECFEDLALWSNNRTLHFMQAGGTLDLEGTFFAPNAGVDSDQWEMRGSSNHNLDGAQFLSYRFDLAGTGRIGLRPDPDRNTTILEPVLTLIR